MESLKEFINNIRAQILGGTSGKNTAKTYLEAHKASRFRVGDRVKIIKKASSFENGWEDVWIEEMDSCVGKTGRIKGDYGSYGFLVVMDDSNYYYTFPYFCLKKVSSNFTTKLLKFFLKLRKTKEV